MLNPHQRKLNNNPKLPRIRTDGWARVSALGLNGGCLIIDIKTIPSSTLIKEKPYFEFVNALAFIFPT